MKELPINKIICGDCLEVMKQLPDECIDMVMTSPPYWGLRDYGIEQVFGGDKNCEHEWDKKIKKWHSDRGSGPRKEVFDDNFQIKGTRDDICIKCQAWKGQLGLEPMSEMYIEHLTDIFNEAKRLLKKEGTLWLNISDTYAGSGGAGGDYNKGGLREGQPKFKQGETRLQPKCLCMIPERLAWSLIQNGWILRNKIIWYKPNAMPSSVTDRFSNRWEYLFMFSRSQRYYFDLDAVREPHKYDGRHDTLYKGGPKDMQIGKHERWPDPAGKNPGDIIADRKWNDVPGQATQAIARDHGGWFRKDGTPIVDFDKGKNPGDFWEINTMPFPEAHFAVFPETLCEKPIKAGCPEQVCKKCGKAKQKISITKSVPTRPARTGKDINHKTYSGNPKRPMAIEVDEKWLSCNCNASFEGGIILDPFAGAGTALFVAKQLRRRFIGVDIKQEYCDMAKKRLAQGVL